MHILYMGPYSISSLLYSKMKSFIFLVFLSVLPFSFESFNATNKNEKILSRKRRYLVFPEGSSLQLVYCLTMPSLGMGRIFTIGSTAAMAWILPHEPMVFLDKKNKKHKDHQVDAKLPELEETPDFAYHGEIYETENHNHYPEYSSLGLDSPGVDEMKEKYYNFENYERRPQTSDYPRRRYQTFEQHLVEPEHWHIYRRTRRSLYGKLEKLLNAMSKDGRGCILKLICEVSQFTDRKGSFMEEIVKVIFRIKTHKNMANEDMYDVAANRKHNCNERYSSCPYSLMRK